MHPDRAQKLYDRYPYIFTERLLPADRTAMSRGIETGDGWFTLIDALCARLQWDTDHCHEPQPVATQVKEKFGSLRFRIHLETESQKGMLDLAWALSERLCETCGCPLGIGKHEREKCAEVAVP